MVCLLSDLVLDLLEVECLAGVAESKSGDIVLLLDAVLFDRLSVSRKVRMGLDCGHGNKNHRPDLRHDDPHEVEGRIARA